MKKNKKEFLSGFIIGAIGMLIGLVLWGWLRNHQMERRNERIVQTINDHSPIYGDGNRLDSATFFPSNREVILHYSFVVAQPDTVVRLCPLFLLTGFDTTFYSVLTSAERDFLFSTNDISSRIYSVAGQLVGIGRPGQLVEMLPELQKEE